jgi:hypothetical protein
MGRSLEEGNARFFMMLYTARCLKKSRGISWSLGWAGVGMTMPKSRALPSNLGCTVKDSSRRCGSQVIKTYCAGCRMSWSFAEK